MRKLLLLACLFFYALTTCSQTHLYVDSSISASGAGSSWGTAYKTLGEGLNAANGASTSTKYVIHVARGTYYPTGAQNGFNRDSSFFIGRGGIQILGGYPSGGGTRDASSNPTILSGNIGSSSSSTDNSYHIMVCAGISATADTTVVEGLRFTAGNANNTSGGKLYNGHFVLRQHGGALHNRYVYAPLLVRDCSFYNNSTVSGGAAIYNDSSALHCINSSFTGNTALSTSATGGAISWINRNLAGAIRLCSFSNNSSGNSAGAISCHNLNTSMMIFGCTFTGNTSKLGGAIEMTRTSTATSIARNWIDSCIFTNNTATQNGGAVRDLNAGGYSTFITRSTFNNNSALLQGGAVHMNNAAFLVCCNYMSWCSFTGNTAGGDGGAVWYTNTGSYAGTMEDCFFTGNKSGGSGGGLYINASSGSGTVGSIENCMFANDTASGRGGGASSTGSLIYTSCSFRNNKAGIGGGLYFSTANYGVIRRDTIQGNVAVLGGGGLYLHHTTTSSAPSVNNCLLAGNKAGTYGGAVYDSSGSTTYLNVTCAGNAASTAANGIYNNVATPDLMNCIIWEGVGSSIVNANNSTPIVTYSTVEGGYTGIGNLSAYPSFVSPVAATAAPTTSGDYKLNFCSPAIDAGYAGSTYSSYTDLARNTRVYTGTVVDQGAYEYQGSSAFSGPVNACIGTTSQYSHTVSGGTWASSNTSRATISSTGVLTPLTAGVDTITYTINGSGCATVFTRIITIHTPPVVPAITGKDSVCPWASGGALGLSNSMSGGTWSSGDTTIAKVVAAGRISGRAPGVVPIYYSVIGAGGCVGKATKIVTVPAPLPVAPITGRKAVCEGDTIHLSNATPGGSWSVSNGTIGPISNAGIVTGSSAGKVAVNYMIISPLLCLSSTTDTVVVNGKPVVGAISAPAYPCLNAISVTVTDTTAGGIWRVNDTSIATINNAGVLNMRRDGSLQISYIVTNANGCTDSVKTQLFIIGIDTSVTQNGNQLSANNGAAFSYQWIDCASNTAIPGATAQSYTALTNGQYAVVMTFSNCRDTSYCYTVQGLSVEGFKQGGLHIYPNPASDEIRIDAMGMRIDEIVLRDALGRMLLQLQATGPKHVLDVSGYPGGLYFVELRVGELLYHRRISIAR